MTTTCRSQGAHNFTQTGGVRDLRQEYTERGFVSLPHLLDETDLNRLHAAFDESVASGRMEVGDTEIIGNNDAIYKHPTFEEYASDERICSVVTELMGRPFELQHSKLMNKPTRDLGKGEILWHQDFPFFPHTNTDLLAVAIHLDDEDKDSGSVRAIPGSHRHGVLSHCEDGEFVYKCTEMVDYRDEETVLFAGKAGNVTVHHSLLLHSSARKNADSPRRVLFYQYRAQDAVQLAGVIWHCTGYQVMPSSDQGYARFMDGSRVETRGAKGRLYDKYGSLAPDQNANASRSLLFGNDKTTTQ